MTEQEWNDIISKRESADGRKFYEEYMGQFHTGHLKEYQGQALICEVVGKDRPEMHCPEPVTHTVSFPDGRRFFVCSLCAKNVRAGAYGLPVSVTDMRREGRA